MLCIILSVLAACTPKESSSDTTLPTETTQPTEPAAVDIPFKYQFHLVFSEPELDFEPIATVIHSKEELQNFYENTQRMYCRNLYNEDLLEFSEVCTEYDEEYFEDKYLILLSFSAGSFDYIHEIPNIIYDDSGQMEICIDRIADGFFADAEGSWCGILEIDREYEAKDIQVNITRYNYPNGRPTDPAEGIWYCEELQVQLDFGAYIEDPEGFYKDYANMSDEEYYRSYIIIDGQKYRCFPSVQSDRPTLIIRYDDPRYDDKHSAVYSSREELFRGTGLALTKNQYVVQDEYTGKLYMFVRIG